MMYDYNKKERYNKRGSIVEKKNGASIRFGTIEFSVTLFTFVHYVNDTHGYYLFNVKLLSFV